MKFILDCSSPTGPNPICPGCSDAMFLTQVPIDYGKPGPYKIEHAFTCYGNGQCSYLGRFFRQPEVELEEIVGLPVAFVKQSLVEKVRGVRK